MYPRVLYLKGKIMQGGVMSPKHLGYDGVLDTDHLENHGQDSIVIGGKPVCAYGVHQDNENSDNRHIGGDAFFATWGRVGLIHS